MATVEPDKYTYRKRSEETKFNWAQVDDYEVMEKRIRAAYVDFDLILASMHEGMVVRTPFAQYQAVEKVDDEESE